MGSNDQLSQAQLNKQLFQKAAQVLKQNDRGNYTVPSAQLYPHQWLWDSCFIAIGQANYDIHRAQIEVMSLLSGQWANGMIPSILMPRTDVISGGRHERIWRSWLNPNAPPAIATSGITQPPMIAEAVHRIGQRLTKNERRRWYKQVFEALVSYHTWLYSERDPHGEGLVLLIHPWEVGLDNTPPWLSELNDHLLPWWIRAMHKAGLTSVFGWFRSDKSFASKQERLTNVEALAYYDVQRRLRRKNYQFSRYIDHSLFAIEDLSFNCILIRANSLLKEIAAEIDEVLEPSLIQSMAKSQKELAKLWEPYAEEYFSRDFITHRLLKVSSIAAFMPLYSGAISHERASKIVNLLVNEHRFGTNYPIPSVPLDSPWFNPKRYWQGPTWVNTNWLIIDGLRRYGFTEQADLLKQKTLSVIQKTGFYEYFNPISGDGLGVNNFSWTAALTIELLSS